MNEETPWIEWAGGECPVPPETRVIVKFRDGRMDDINPAQARFWSGGTYDWWRHNPPCSVDIIAYRVVPA